MAKWVFAGAASLDDIPGFCRSAEAIGLDFILIENAYMAERLPADSRSFVTQMASYNYQGEIFIPLNEYWVTEADRRQVANIPGHAFRASRSKHFLSRLLSEHGLCSVARRYLDEFQDLVPENSIVRLDAAYSGYSVIRTDDLQTHPSGPGVSKEMVLQAMAALPETSMPDILGVRDNPVLVEACLTGSEYSVDVLVNHGQVQVLRLFYKSVKWRSGYPVCDCYVALPVSAQWSGIIASWCHALFSKDSVSFAHFDFIDTGTALLPLDFSCRIGGGLDPIKSYANRGSYVFNALFSAQESFSPFMVQKHLVSERPGHLNAVHYGRPFEYHVVHHKQPGDVLHNNPASANARIADICFTADSLQQALAQADTLDACIRLDIRP